VSPVIVLDAWRLVRPGRDFAIVDRRDRVQRNGRQACEQVDNGSRTKPRPGRVYLQSRRCAASAGAIGLGLPAMHRYVPLRYSILLKAGYRRAAA
jgi:hypothetical protein